MVEGASIVVSSEAAQALGMALHELATNATKYGALSRVDGVVTIAWGVRGSSETLSMSWVETGGPTVTQPTRSGFGRAVIVSMVERALAAKVTLNYDPSGVTWNVEAPLSVVRKS